MLNRPLLRSRTASRGVSMIEVLVTIMIVTVGLLGAAGMQSRLQIAEIESYQRAQAIVLLQDMVDRVSANRKDTASYVTSALTPAYIGNSATAGTEVTFAWDCTASPPTITQAQKDLCEWSKLVFGASETLGGNKVGAMNGGRGCIELTAATMPREALVSVAWQGITPTKAPDAALTCASGQYGNELNRRVITARVKIGCLQNNPGGTCVTP